MSDWVASRAVHLRFFKTESVGCIVFDAGVVRFVGTNHAVEAHGFPDREFVGRICEDKSQRAACVGAKGDGVEDGEYGLTEVDYIVVSWRANDGDVALLSSVEHGDDVQGGQHDGRGNLWIRL